MTPMGPKKPRQRVLVDVVAEERHKKELLRLRETRFKFKEDPERKKGNDTQ